MTPFQVALTFDAEHPDRPAEAGNAERLLDALAESRVRATFFVQGRWAEAYPATARRIGRDGHLVGSHSHYHARMPLLSATGLANDIRDAEAAIVEHAGINPRPWFRCPFGAGGEDRRVLATLETLGYREIGWNVNPEDWNPARTAAEVEAAIVAGATSHGDGAVVLQHTWPNQNLIAVPRIVAGLRQRGATFIGVDELAILPTRHPG